MSIDWFKSWHGAPTDNKWLVIAKRANVSPGIVSAIVWALLDCASQSGNRGSIETFDIETYSTYSGFSEEQIGAVINSLKDKELIENNVFSAWDRRQDNSTDRVRKHREMKRMKHDETHETTDKTRLDKIREEKKVSNPPKPPKGEIVLPDWMPISVWEGFKAHRGNKFTVSAQRLAIDKLERWRSEGHDPTEIINNSIMNGWKGLFEPKKETKNGAGIDYTRLEAASNAAAKHARSRPGNRKVQAGLFAEGNGGFEDISPDGEIPHRALSDTG